MLYICPNFFQHQRADGTDVRDTFSLYTVLPPQKPFHGGISALSFRTWQGGSRWEPTVSVVFPSLLFLYTQIPAVRTHTGRRDFFWGEKLSEHDLKI